ncbi:MAG: DUF6514 family protein [Clostridia bacterium]|nr:DUF6514 family protein [Clostridia bacterium]
MLNKYLEKKIELLPNENMIGFKNPIELEYYLLESDNSDIDELSGKRVYGIEIVKKVNAMKVEEELVRNFSCCKEDTRQVLDKLANNTVTPVALSFVIDDILGL